MDRSIETAERTLRQPLVDPTDSERKPLRDVESLESILTESSLPSRRRLYLGARIEMKLLFRLALPAIFVYLLNSGMSISTRIFAGHIGSQELAAVSIGNSCFNLVYGLMVSFTSSCTPASTSTYIWRHVDISYIIFFLLLQFAIYIYIYMCVHIIKIIIYRGVKYSIGFLFFILNRMLFFLELKITFLYLKEELNEYFLKTYIERKSVL